MSLIPAGSLAINQSTGNLTVSSGTGQWMTIGSNGNVGIGLTNPSSKLDIHDPVLENIKMDFYDWIVTVARKRDFKSIGVGFAFDVIEGFEKIESQSNYIEMSEFISSIYSKVDMLKLDMEDRAYFGCLLDRIISISWLTMFDYQEVQFGR